MSKINFLIMFYLVQLSKSFLTKEIHNPISRKITRTMSGKLNSKQKIYNFEKKYSARSEGQTRYKKSLYDKDIDLLVCNGPAGTGKTSLACEYSLDMLKKNKIKKIIITRPTKTIEENLGYLPGDINEKMYPWTLPIFDIFKEYFTQSEIDFYLKDNIIEICPLGFIQGRTFKNSIIIADEMQNSSESQMFMLLTRLGENSKMIINGDLNQIKNKNGLEDLINKLNSNYPSELDKYENSISLIQLNNEDIQRHDLIKKIIEMYKQ